MKFQSTKPQGFDSFPPYSPLNTPYFNPRSRKASTFQASNKCCLYIFQSTKPQGFDEYIGERQDQMQISIHEAARLRQQKHPKKNLISQNNLYTYYNIPTHNNYILIILNLFTIKSTIFQVRISRDFHVHFLFAPNNSIIKYHH